MTRTSADFAPRLSSPTGPQGLPLNPDAPRAIERWNDYEWEPHGFAANWPRRRPSSTRRPTNSRPPP
ncbi:DUF6087 family protein [Streptomyces sp. NPDC005322]|uniref:DUF6087 family protein n=1 Tax=Streptomyces sp. NPDC005322 TaxID=3157032 RepID=UPI0033B79D17